MEYNIFLGALRTSKPSQTCSFLPIPTGSRIIERKIIWTSHQIIPCFYSYYYVVDLWWAFCNLWMQTYPKSERLAPLHSKLLASAAGQECHVHKESSMQRFISNPWTHISWSVPETTCPSDEITLQDPPETWSRGKSPSNSHLLWTQARQPPQAHWTRTLAKLLLDTNKSYLRCGEWVHSVPELCRHWRRVDCLLVAVFASCLESEDLLLRAFFFGLVLVLKVSGH